MAIQHTSPAGRLAALAALLLPVAFNPLGSTPFWAPKAAVLIIVGAAGLPVLLRMTRTEKGPAAWAAIGFLAIAATSTLLSSDRVASVVGIYNWGTGLAFIAGCVGLWAIGSAVPEAERRVVVVALLIGIGISSVVAVLQALDIVRADSLQAVGRAWGLSGNAGRLATLAVGMTAVGAFGARNRAPWVLVAAAGALVVQVTGTRSALVLVVAVALAGALRCARWRGVLLITVTVAGVAVGSWLAGVGGLATATGRSSASGTSIVTGGPEANVRLEVWGSALHAVARRPFIGSGPGRFRAATSQDRTLLVARAEGGEVIYADAHNVVVEQLVTTGLLGAAAFLLWVIFAFRRARGALAWFAGAVFAMSLVQPMDPGVTPLLFLALGVAASVPLMPRLAPSMVFASVALVAAVVLVVGDTQLLTAYERRDLGLANRADVLLRPWSQPASVLAGIHTTRWQSGREPVDAALAWRREALHRDPTNPGLAVLLAELERRAGQPAAAVRDFRLALTHNPWSVRAMQALAELAGERGDNAAAERYARSALEVAPNPDLSRLLHRVEVRQR